MNSRRLAQAAAAVLATLLLAACNADPAAYPHGEQAGSEEDGSLLRTVLVYVVLPAVVLGAIALAAWLPGMARSTRYRPQYGWSAAPVWFAGPSGDAVAAVEHAQVGDSRRGGTGGSW